MAKRSDPVGTNSRTLSGGLSSKIKNQDPNRRYVGVYARDDRALDMYLGLGYEAEIYQEEGAQWARMRKPKLGGEQIHNGMLLMSISADEYDAIQREGVPGVCEGLDGANRVESTMRKASGAFNPLNGLENGRGLVRAAIPRTNPGANALCDA